MRTYKETTEIICFTEEEAKQVIENYRQEAREKGFTIGAAGYTYKIKKSKGEIIGEIYLVKIAQIFGELWEELVDE